MAILTRIVLWCSLLGLAACRSTPVVVDGSWEVVSIGGEPLATSSAAMPEVPMIRFVADSSRVMGYGGCNQFTGPFHQSSDSVRIGPLASTKRMCLGIDIESRIFAAFDRTTTVERTGDVLRLRAGDTVLMECRPAASPRTNP